MRVQVLVLVRVRVLMRLVMLVQVRVRVRVDAVERRGGRRARELRVRRGAVQRARAPARASVRGCRGGRRAGVGREA